MAAAMSASPIDESRDFASGKLDDLDDDPKMDWNTNSLHTTGVSPPAGKRISRLQLRAAAAASTTTTTKPKQGQQQTSGGTNGVDDAESGSPSPPSYTEPAPRLLFYETVLRDFAYSPSHYLHNGPTDIDEGGPDHMQAPETRRSRSQLRRSSDSGESSTVNSGINSGAHWTPGIWGGDGAIYEDMSPLPSTSFHTSSEERRSSFHRQQNQQHRKSRSYADVYSYERGRRREHSAAKRGSFLSGGNGNESGHADPAGREALRASRGIEPSGDQDLEDDMYALSMQPSTRPRRDSHVAQQTLPSGSYHEERTSGFADTISDLPLDHEDTQENHSPQRESLGPEDEELFAGPSLALYDFEPENDNELRIREKEIIMVSYRHGQGWLVAQNAAGDAGLVPEAYVRLLSEMEDWEEVVSEDREEEVDSAKDGDTANVQTEENVQHSPEEDTDTRSHKEHWKKEPLAETRHHPALS